MARLFLAVRPPPDVVEILAALPRKDRRGVRFVAPDSWHVTLRFLGEASEQAVMTAMAGVDLPAATVRLGPGTDLLGERVLVVPAHGLQRLAGAVIAATGDLGERPPRRAFHGHVTMARLKPGARLDGLVGFPLVGGAVEFPVQSVELISSRLRADGARYETLASWPVGG